MKLILKHMSKLVAAVERLSSSQGANVAVTFAIAVLPIMLGIGVSVDYSRTLMQKAGLQTAVDAAALNVMADAASLTADQINARVQSIIVASLASTELTNLTISATYDASKQQLSVAASGTLPMRLMSLAGTSQVIISQSGISQVDAILTPRQVQSVRRWPVCLMVTAPTAKHALFASGTNNSLGSSISIKDCMLQVNTNHWDAVETDKPSARIIGSNSEFCFHGGYIHNVKTHGTITTTVDGVTPNYVYGTPPADASDVGTSGVWDKNCPTFADPLAGMTSLLAGATCKANSLTISTNTALAPGRYCGNITISGGTVTFSPGFFQIDGTLTVSGGTVTGDGVALYFTGNSAGLDISGGTVTFTPSTDASVGAFAGVTIYVQNTTPATACNRDDANPSAPGTGNYSSSCVNAITGGTFNFSGIAYFPRLAFWVRNTAVVTATQAGLIADYVATTDQAQLSITGIGNSATASQLLLMQSSQAGYTSTSTVYDVSYSSPRLVR